MRTFDFSKETPFHWEDKSLLLLGEEINELDGKSKKQLLEKLATPSLVNLDETWGTLAWKDSNAFDLKGKLQFSELGNQRSEGSTL